MYLLWLSSLSLLYLNFFLSFLFISFFHPFLPVALFVCDSSSLIPSASSSSCISPSATTTSIVRVMRRLASSSLLAPAGRPREHYDLKLPRNNSVFYFGVTGIRIPSGVFYDVLDDAAWTKSIAKKRQAIFIYYCCILQNLITYWMYSLRNFSFFNDK